jgi:hypothetical protein
VSSALTAQANPSPLRARHPDDVTAVDAENRFIVAFIGVMDHGDLSRSQGVPDAVLPGDEDEPTGYSLTLNRGHPAPL